MPSKDNKIDVTLGGLIAWIVIPIVSYRFLKRRIA